MRPCPQDTLKHKLYFVSVLVKNANQGGLGPEIPGVDVQTGRAQWYGASSLGLLNLCFKLFID